MPTTVNGIGTHYYGRKNLSTRHGVCQACNRQSRLQSYDTRLWFVVLYIPAIPLGRKRIMDQCSICHRHWAADQQQWVMGGQLNVSGAKERYRATPSVPAALEAHGMMLSYRLHDEAAKFRGEALANHPDSAALRAGLASHLDATGGYTDATPLYEQALALEPHLPEARIGLAYRRMTAGELDEAKKLLDFLMEPGAGQVYSLAALDTLAGLYQKQGRHEETLAICERLLAEYPQIGQQHRFRKFVQTSEKAAGRGMSLLPDQSFSFRDLFDKKSGRYPGWVRGWVFAGMAATLVVGCLAAHNEYRRQHREVRVDNAFPQAADVTIDGGPPLHVATSATVVLSEGPHHVQIAGPVTEEFDIDLEAGYFARWTKDPVWIVNVGGANAYEFHTVHYAVNPQPTQVDLLVGERFLSFPHVDDAFTPPPAQLKIEGRNQTRTRIHIERTMVPVDDAFQYALGTTGGTKVLDFGEANLLIDPDNVELLYAYVGACAGSANVGRAEKFLKGGLSRRPVEVEWHRAYQELGRGVEREPALIADYDAALQAEPQNAALLYLRGRIATDRQEGLALFRQAADSEPALGWPWRALAYDAASCGNWEECLKLLEQGPPLDKTDANATRLWHEARLGTGDLAALETEYRQQLSPQDPAAGAPTLMHLCDVLAAEGKIEDAREALTDWGNRVAVQYPQDQGLRFVRLMVYYALGDFDKISQETASLPQQATSYIRLEVALATGRVEDIPPGGGLEGAPQEAWTALELALAYQLRGDEMRYAEWIGKACAKLDDGAADSRRAAALLQSTDAPTREALDNVTLDARNKAVLAAVLAAKFPEQGDELAALARTLNITRVPPFHLVARAAGPPSPISQ
jgi:tetratricopeptide (TPR) repeat protein